MTQLFAFAVITDVGILFGSRAIGRDVSVAIFLAVVTSAIPASVVASGITKAFYLAISCKAAVIAKIEMSANECPVRFYFMRDCRWMSYRIYEKKF